MGGYLGTPERVLKKRVGNVDFIVHRVADILNQNDPDVSFAYTFCGSAECSLDGKNDPAKEAAERGRQKAQIEYHDPEWRPFYDLWAKSLKGLGHFKINVWDYGENIANPFVNGIIGGKRYQIDLSPEEMSVRLTGQTIGTEDAVRLGESCKKRLREMAKKLGVAEREIDRAIKNKGLFLISSDDD